jgi:phosphomannomutase
MEKVAGAWPDAPKDTLDGLSLDCGDFWCNVRPSNTEPLLRLNLEAIDTETCRRATDEVLALIRGA